MPFIYIASYRLTHAPDLVLKLRGSSFLKVRLFFQRGGSIFGGQEDLTEKILERLGDSRLFFGGRAGGGEKDRRVDSKGREVSEPAVLGKWIAFFGKGHLGTWEARVLGTNRNGSFLHGRSFIFYWEPASERWAALR